MKIGLVSVMVDDPNKALQFYTEVLGFVTRVHVPEAYLAIVASPEAPDGPGLLLEPSDNPIAGPFRQGLYQQGLPVIVFHVDDIESEYQRLQERGVVFTQPPARSEVGTQAVFDDTCGNLIQLFKP